MPILNGGHLQFVVKQLGVEAWPSLVPRHVRISPLAQLTTFFFILSACCEY